MSDVIAIVPPGQGMGFTLAGIDIRETATREEALGALEEEMDDERNGVIFIDEDYLENLPRNLQRRVDETVVPLVVGLPVISKWEYVHDQDERFQRIVQRAIGYRIKLFGED